MKFRFGSAARRLHEARAIRKEELAERADLHRNYIGGIERGERNVGLENIVKLAKALSVAPIIVITTRQHVSWKAAIDRGAGIESQAAIPVAFELQWLLE